MSRSDLAKRLQQVEDTLEIQQLAVRYAMAVDERDIDTLLELFVADVSVGHDPGRTRSPARNEES